ncbi:MAG: hypothetical protein ACRD4G_09875, partial [Bryobacteraceae bacterium]
RRLRRRPVQSGHLPLERHLTPMLNSAKGESGNAICRPYIGTGAQISSLLNRYWPDHRCIWHFTAAEYSNE